MSISNPEIQSLFPFLTRLRRGVLTAALCSALCAGLSATGAATAGPAAEITGAEGLAKPTLAFNLAEVRFWGTNIPFIDLMKMAGQFRIGNRDRLEDRFLDDRGWPRFIPPGAQQLTAVFQLGGSDVAGPSVKLGRYVLSFEGQGTIRVRGGTVVSQTDTQIVFDYPRASSLMIEILETDPAKTGDHLRNMTLVHADHVALHEAGALFNPDWLKVVADASQVRFMDWMHTNNSPASEWSDMVSAAYGSWSTKGVPLEVMVTLANQIGADPWFTMPHLATDDYVRNFATYVRDHLDPELKATVEYSNEAWNNAFRHTQWMHSEAKRVFKTEKAWSFDYYAMRATQVAMIWKEVFGAEAETRMIAALGTQTANPTVARRLLKAERWRQLDPAGFTAPETVFDALAVTTYFGGELARLDEERDKLITAIRDPRTDAAAYVSELLSTDPQHGSNAKLQGFWAENAKLARDAGLDLIAYEGGQHLHHSFATKIPESQIKMLSAFFSEFVRSDAMAALYAANWDAWAEVADGPYMQFSDVTPPSRWGSWGLLANLTDNTPRSELLFARNASETPWWEDPRSGAQAQHGRILFAAETGETLRGTVQEDFLIGAAGDDTLVGGPGDDGLHGGDGTDTVLLSGAPEAYTISAEGDGWRLEGPDGSDFLIAVEQLGFDAGPTLAVTEFAARTAN